MRAHEVSNNNNNNNNNNNIYKTVLLQEKSNFRKELKMLCNFIHRQ